MLKSYCKVHGAVTIEDKDRQTDTKHGIEKKLQNKSYFLLSLGCYLGVVAKPTSVIVVIHLFTHATVMHSL